MKPAKITLAIHGGAGTILRSEMSHQLESEYRSGLEASLRSGWTVLEVGGSALDAVEAAVVELENCPLFNAGKGAVFTHDGRNEMDAAVMNGETLRAGAVAFVKNVKNPVRLARLVMEQTQHVLLAGEGANEFAKSQRVEFEPDEYFFTEHRFAQLQKARTAGIIQLDHSNGANPTSPPTSKIQTPKSNLGTVGAVACDAFGNLAAATSTGGMTNKSFGRIGDTPIIGSGTYAENSTCAVSCTGHGEYFMLGSTAFDVAARMKYKNIGLEEAAREAIARLSEIGGEGGFIAVDSAGNVVMPFNSEGMYRGCVSDQREIHVEIYRN